MSRVEQALSCFKNYSCSQSILSTFGPQFGLSRDLALKLASGYGGGVARLGGVCGAINGAIMVLGLKYGQGEKDTENTKEDIYRITRQFLSEFEEKNGSTLCKELLTCDINTSEGIKKAMDEGFFTTICPRVVKNAAMLLEKLL